MKPAPSVSVSTGSWQPANSEPGMPPVKITFLLIALVFVGVSVMEYFKGDRKLTLRGKILLRMAVIFAAFSAYLFWRN